MSNVYRQGRSRGGSSGSATIPDGSIEVSKLSAAAIASLRQTPDDSISYPKLTPEAIATLEDEINRFWGDWDAAIEGSYASIEENTGFHIGDQERCITSALAQNTAAFNVKSSAISTSYPVVVCGTQCSGLPDITGGTLRSGILFQDGDGRRWFLPNCNPEQPDGETWFYLNNSSVWVAQSYNGDELQQSLASLPQDGNWWPVESGIHGLPSANIFDDEPLMVRWTDNQQMVIRINYNANDNTNEIFSTCRTYEVDVFDGAAELTDSPGDDDLLLVSDDSDSGIQKTRKFTDLAEDIRKYDASQFNEVFDNYSFKSNGAVGASGQVGWASGAVSVTIIPRSADTADMDRKVRVGVEFRVQQRNAAGKWIAGVVSVVTPSGNNRQYTVHEVVTGPDGAPDNDAAVDVWSLGSGIQVRDVFHLGQTYTDTTSFTVPSVDIIRKMLDPLFAHAGGIPGGDLNLYTKGILSVSVPNSGENAGILQAPSNGEMRNRAVDANLWVGGDKSRVGNGVAVGSTNSFQIPNADNYFMHGKLRVEATKHINYLEIRIPVTDDFTHVRFYRDEGLNTDLDGYSNAQHSSTTHDVNVIKYLNHSQGDLNSELATWFTDSDNDDSTDELRSGDVLWIEWFFIEGGGGQSTTLEFRTSTAGSWEPLTCFSDGLKLSPTGDYAGWVNMVS